MKARTLEELSAVLAQCKYHNWQFRVALDGDRPYLQLHFAAPCAVSGLMQDWSTRKWPLSVYMTDSELVGTAFKAVLTAVEHEARECFRWGGRPVFGPHISVHALWEVANSLDVREVLP